MNTSASFILLDKPSGPSSHAMVNKIRKVSGEKRVGHAGTLDPLASGLLIVAIGRAATREIDKFRDLDKEYELEAIFGFTSDTYDSQGKVQKNLDLSPITESQLQSVIKDFQGELMQKPPVFSAKKVGGRKAYDMARRGQIVDLAAVPVFISSFELISYEWPTWKARVRCSKGTYVRSLIHDIGQALGVGSIMTALRRTAIGSFTANEALSVDQVEESWSSKILSLDEVFHRL